MRPASTIIPKAKSATPGTSTGKIVMAAAKAAHDLRDTAALLMQTAGGAV